MQNNADDSALAPVEIELSVSEWRDLELDAAETHAPIAVPFFVMYSIDINCSQPGGGVIKKILVPGAGDERPEKGDQVYGELGKSTDLGIWTTRKLATFHAQLGCQDLPGARVGSVTLPATRQPPGIS